MFAKINGIKIAYTDEGAGLPLLFIHGFPLNRRAWSHQVEAFKTRYRVIAPDLRGFGESGSSSGPVSMISFAEDIWLLMQHLGLGPAILAGHSMGGCIALAIAKMYPKVVRGIALVGTKASMDSYEVANNRRLMAEKVRLEGASVVVDAMAPLMLSATNRDKFMAASVRGFMTPANSEGIIGALLGMAEQPDAGEWLGKIRVPTLVIAGSDDTIIPPSESEALARAIPHVRQRVIPHAGHLVAVDQADAFNEAIQDWLAWGCEGPKPSRYRAHPIQKSIQPCPL